MANAEVSSSPSVSQCSKRPSNTVVPPPTPPFDVESPNDSPSDGQEEPREEDPNGMRSESENKIPFPAGSDLQSEGNAVFSDDSSFGKDTVFQDPMLVTKLETEQEERDLPAVKLDTSTPDQPNEECQVAKSGSEKKRKSHDGSKNIESLFQRPDRRLTRSNSRIIPKGMDHGQKVAKRLTRSQKSSPVDYLGDDVDILGLERALKRLTRTGSKRVLQEPAIDDDPPNSLPDKASDCIMSHLPDLDGSSDMVNTGVTIIEEIMETIQEDETPPLCVEIPIKELDGPSDEQEKDSVSMEADNTIEETNVVCAKEEPILLLEFIRDEPMHESKNAEQPVVVPMEVCPTAVEGSCDANTLKNPRLEIPLKRLTRSALKNAQMGVTGSSGFGSIMNELIPKNENVEEQEAVAAKEPIPVSMDRSIDMDKMDKPEFGTPSRRFTRSALKNAQMDVTPFLGFRSTIDEPRPENVNAKKEEVNPVSMDGSCGTSTNILEKSELGVPTKRLTRSALKNAQTASNELEFSPRRFTRSLLKVNASYNEEDGPGDNVDVSELERPTKRVSRSSQKGNKSESGPMVSSACKKFDLIKPPSNARELLATGFLEGLDVMYIVPHSKKPVLKGVINGGNILCFCSTCHGFRSVSAYNFEVHAGSTKKHPSDFIFLENGNTLRDVLRICASVRIDDLEAALRNEVGPISKKNLRACLRCGSLLTSDVAKFFLCDSCSEANQLLPPDSTSSMIQSPVTTHRSLIPGASQNSVEMPSKNVSSSTSALSSLTKKTNTVGRLTRKNTGLHKLVFMGDILPEGTEVAYYVGGKRLLDGYIKDGAIFCHCCMAVVSPSQFEAHAGQASRRKPYNNIYTSNGVSLHELSVSLSKHKMISLGETDDLCSICSDSGDLILCDFCPRAFHKDCVGLTETPEGDWYCQFCVSLHRRDNCVASNDNARAAGRVEGVDPIEQIFKRCIRILSVSDTDLGGCTICKLHDFSKLGFDDRTVILCDQCQREYHVGCLRDCNMADLKELPEGEWFCSSDCSVMHVALKEVILGGPQSLTSSDIELIRRKTEEKGSSNNGNEKKIVDYDNIRWRLLSGATAQEVEDQLLSGAVSIFHESFDPIIDAKSRRDLIPAMVNGMSIEGHQDYSGMYCAVLTIGSKVVSAGLLRIFGTNAAELPLVATSRDLQGLGYFQALFGSMERMLIELKVRHFLLPAAEEAESIWIKKFGFTRISSEQLEDYLKGAHLTAFRGTSSLHKPLFVS